MKELRDINFQGKRIVEHREDGSRDGIIDYAAANGDGSFAVGWTQFGGGSRTTTFSPRSWMSEVGRYAVSFMRIAPDKGLGDLPSPDANMYSIAL